MERLTKEAREAIRARCETATPGEWVLPSSFDGICSQNGDIIITLQKRRNHINNMLFLAHARQDIPALLDALDAAERRNELLIEKYKRCDLCKAGQAVGKLVTDRDRWKARAEALERRRWSG